MIRSHSIRVSVGEDYVKNVPLARGKHIPSRRNDGRSVSEKSIQSRCVAAGEETSPQMASDTE